MLQGYIYQNGGVHTTIISTISFNLSTRKVQVSLDITIFPISSLVALPGLAVLADAEKKSLRFCIRAKSVLWTVILNLTLTAQPVLVKGLFKTLAVKEPDW